MPPAPGAVRLQEVSDVLARLRTLVYGAARITRQLTGGEQYELVQQLKQLEQEIGRLADAITADDLAQWNDFTPGHQRVRRQENRRLTLANAEGVLNE